MHDIPYLIEVPRLRIQNANAVSSPLTWGFPAMSAFVGLMHALERKLRAAGVELKFDSVGVVCHRHEPQSSRSGYVHGFHLTRNPVGKSGETAAIVEEGRTHLEVTLIFGVSGEAAQAHSNETGPDVIEPISDALYSLRIAGGSIQPPPMQGSQLPCPRLITVAESEDDRARQSRNLLLRWLPGFALISRDDLLHAHLEQLKQKEPETDLLDAWLDLARLNMACHVEEPTDQSHKATPSVYWERRGPKGWLVPIPVGYGALSEVYEPGTAKGARDEKTPFRFVESLYSIGEWKSPHRLGSPADLLWYVDNREVEGLYRLRNDHGNISSATN